MRHIRLSLAVLITLVAFVPLAGCRRSAPEGEVWFVQATDPHLFYGDMKDDQVRLRQEKMNQEAFAELITNLDDLPGDDPEPAFLVVSGDFGLDRFGKELQAAAAAAPRQPAGGAAPAGTPTPEVSPTPTPSPEPIPSPEPSPSPSPVPSTAPAAASATLGSAVRHVVEILSKSPVKDIYLVPGNNDIDGEAPEGAPVDAAQLFWNRVQTELAGKGVTLHDLTTCYFGEALPSGCYADVAGTFYRLIGFPSHSFKDGVDATRSRVQQAQLEKLGSLVAQASQQGKRVLIVTHIPEIDDPHTLAVNEMQKDPDRTKWATGRPDWAAASPWNVPPALYAKWQEIVGSRAVAGVLAGHFHDSHKEIYRPPYEWATVSAERASFDKLYLTPPLSVRFQDESPIQARGFALFRLKGKDDPERVLFWYDRKGKTFEREESGRPARPSVDEEREGSLSERTVAATAFIWGAAGDKARLGRLAVIAIAFLAAFLTVAQLWEVPPPSTRPATSASPAPAGSSSAASASTTASPPAGIPTYGSASLLFQGNFARTVLSGLAGLALVSTFDGLWQNQGIQEKPYFLVLFVLLFSLILLLAALLRGLTEAMRSRISLSRRYPKREKGFSYILKRAWSWFLSLRIPVLIFADTAFNVVLGRNQLRTAEFENELSRIHESILAAVDRIRKEIDDTLQESLNRRRSKAGGVTSGTEATAGNPLQPGGVASKEQAPKHDVHQNLDVRVGISVMAQDESALYYISRERGSVAHGFGPGSMAWIAVHIGRPLWWRESYEQHRDRIVIIENGLLSATSKELRYPALASGKLLLRDYLQWRGKPDYGAFLVLPLPWLNRDPDGEQRKAGIHISFKHEEDLELLWGNLPATEGQDEPLNLYDECDDLLRHRKAPGDGPYLKSERVAEVLNRNIPLLTDLLSHFNDVIFEEYVRPRLRPQ